jgi:hypothetical protein
MCSANPRGRGKASLVQTLTDLRKQGSLLDSLIRKNYRVIVFESRTVLYGCTYIVLRRGERKLLSAFQTVFLKKRLFAHSSKQGLRADPCSTDGA